MSDDLRTLVERFEGQINEWEMWDRDPTQAFDRLAEQFYQETGLMAPGKSVPMEMASTQDDDERRQRYNEWCKARTAVRRSMLRDVLAALSRPQTPAQPDETSALTWAQRAGMNWTGLREALALDDNDPAVGSYVRLLNVQVGKLLKALEPAPAPQAQTPEPEVTIEQVAGCVDFGNVTTKQILDDLRGAAPQAEPTPAAHAISREKP